MPACHNHSSFLTADEKKVLAVAYLLPGAAKVVGAAAYARFPAGVAFLKRLGLKKCEKPSYAPPCGRCYIALDTIAILPIGCAAMLAYKHGGGCSNSIVAGGLGAYSASAILGGSLVPVFLSGNLKAGAAVAAAAAGAATVAAVLFGKAGAMLIPWIGAHAYYAFVLAHIKPPPAS